MWLDKDELTDELTKFHIGALYDFICPSSLDCTAEELLGRTERATKRYYNDPMFNARVESTVAWTLHLIDKNMHSEE